jgi:hypothetical protein
LLKISLISVNFTLSITGELSQTPALAGNSYFERLALLPAGNFCFMSPRFSSMV